MKSSVSMHNITISKAMDNKIANKTHLMAPLAENDDEHALLR